MLDELLDDFPAVSLVGPRAAGKTTTALVHARSILRLDRPGEAAVVGADPDAAIRDQSEPLLIDEWQERPAVLGAVKRAVDADPRPGRFLLTGSVRAPLETSSWPGTGRIVHLPVTPMSLRERFGETDRAPFIERVARSGLEELVVPPSAPDLRDYVALLVESGFPEPALRLPPRARERWLDAYLEHLVTRDARLVDHGRDPVRLRRTVEALALASGGLCEAKTLHEAAGIARMTFEAYERLLTELFILELAPAWSSNRLKRLIKKPKRYLVDTGLALAAAHVGPEAIMRDHEVLGRMLDTLVAAELRAELPACPSRPRLHHLRTEGGRQEIDLVVELGGGRVLAIEVKAAARVGPVDARHLVWLRDQLGEAFVHGLVLHTGPGKFRLADRIGAAPVATLWA